ncbi:hypothetical protein PR003_g7262 [Phytophthora rubi]|uniref:Uncharacterized protein n=1 Tax=Phytophthora rubi TaxID=129364 RepID=A0A6A3MRK5_9STRA|nr:hypothetical protein PR002_g7412 [Phytophthora rubi]KAE9049842.1 hypothetical protein PR001_g2936 [Phytophthora rubi]KAE9346777.1 hypothetical protein PR003_g7262 [Phytophthora rubi]
MTTWLAEQYPDTANADWKTLRIPLPKDAVLAFFGNICSSVDACHRNGIPADEAPACRCPLLVSGATGVRQSVDAYRAERYELDPLLDTELRRVLDAYKKVINAMKKLGLMKINEGKHCLKASGNGLLSLKLMAG